MSLANVTVNRLVRAAQEARGAAHAPYSEFRVGAAVLSTDGRLFIGCNVENASYGLSVCAERNAISAAVVDGAGTLTALAVATGSSALATPCGACRQVICELKIETVVLANSRGDVQTLPAAELLPLPFAGADLRQLQT